MFIIRSKRKYAPPIYLKQLEQQGGGLLPTAGQVPQFAGNQRHQVLGQVAARTLQVLGHAAGGLLEPGHGGSQALVAHLEQEPQVLLPTYGVVDLQCSHKVC